MNQEFKNIVKLLHRKYMCPDLSIQTYELDEEQVAKRQFDDKDLHFERYQSVNLENGFLLIPPFYEEAINLPAVGTKFIRSRVDLYCGDLAQVTVEIGYWRLKPHDIQHKDYVVTGKKTVGFAFFREENRWAMLNLDDWKKRKKAMDEDLSNPILRQMELDFFNHLTLTVQSREKYVTLLLEEDANLLIENLYALEWYVKNVPMLWSAFKLYPLEMYTHVVKRVNAIYDDALKDAESFLKKFEGSEVIPNEGEMLVLDRALKPILLEGYEVIHDTVYSNVLRMYLERQQTDKFANLETLRQYQEIAFNLSKKQQDAFVWFKEVINKHNLMY
jgi:hypothetical protein